MLRRLLLLIALVHNLSLLSGCSSGDSADEGSEAAATKEESGGEAKADAADSDEGEEGDSADAADSDEGEEGDVASDDEDSDSDEVATKDDAADDEDSEDVADAGDDEDLKEEPKADVKAEPVTEVAEAKPTEPTFSDSAMTEAPVVSAPVGGVPLKKIKDAPYKVGGVLANAVYLARPGDSVESISQKIYGADKTESIFVVNPNLKRGVKTGDKVYYNSPQRPTDDTKMMVYYEDAGAAPQMYTAKEGDNIRKVSKELLSGDENSWKEVWATNMDVESKAELAAGTQLRYWPAGAAPVAPSEPPPQQMAQNTPPPPADIPPPPPANDFPSDVVANTNASQDNIDIPPPPPQAPPPPPEIARPAKKPDGGSSIASLMEDPQNMMIIGGAIFAIIALVGIAFTRKRRSRIDFGQTQV